MSRLVFYHASLPYHEDIIEWCYNTFGPREEGGWTFNVYGDDDMIELIFLDPEDYMLCVMKWK